MVRKMSGLGSFVLDSEETRKLRRSLCGRVCYCMLLCVTGQYGAVRCTVQSNELHCTEQ